MVKLLILVGNIFGGIINPSLTISILQRQKQKYQRQRRAINIGLAKKLSEEHKKKLSEAAQDKKQTAEHILNKSLATIKFDPDNPYCDVWKDEEYKKDIRKDYCENADCKKISKKLCNHHIHLDKKRCKPNDIMTICNSCHAILHRQLQRGSNKAADSKDFIVINRPDHVSYIRKKSHEIIRINKIIKKI